ncbi:MAG: glycerol-3-phosphate dehydrogenase C-terminal domain-containing protein [Nitrospinales bacterium]
MAEIDRLLTNYGSEFNSLMACVGIDGARNSNRKISHAVVLKAETWYAVRQEMAQKLSDVVLRRLRCRSTQNRKGDSRHAIRIQFKKHCLSYGRGAWMVRNENHRRD